ncbi:YMGG-like glycine zipper-containing protein [Erythrobacter sp. WG]|uniref:YMGG-like glycine zipper-containing protein n=1 Tax=Erythrobacter sp. WG TaxID=2985510 RepID=UPI002271D737|nr:glycine zipper domain-containing protein [Erythrobacter sp. WG]MCX9146226.1 glycine zipper domain-containing protein [Erythrobacter sp. WG]
MTNRFMAAAVGLTASLSLGACASNYAGEGALAGAAAGAAVGAVTGGDIGTGAAIGAAAGAAGGTLIRKNDGRCYRVDNRGRERRVSCR